MLPSSKIEGVPEPIPTACCQDLLAKHHFQWRSLEQSWDNNNQEIIPCQPYARNTAEQFFVRHPKGRRTVVDPRWPGREQSQEKWKAKDSQDDSVSGRDPLPSLQVQISKEGLKQARDACIFGITFWIRGRSVKKNYFCESLIGLFRWRKGSRAVKLMINK